MNLFVQIVYVTITTSNLAAGVWDRTLILCVYLPNYPTL